MQHWQGYKSLSIKGISKLSFCILTSLQCPAICQVLTHHIIMYINAMLSFCNHGKRSLCKMSRTAHWLGNSWYFYAKPSIEVPYWVMWKMAKTWSGLIKYPVRMPSISYLLFSFLILLSNNFSSFVKSWSLDYVIFEP